MPELPEVENQMRDLRRLIKGRTVKKVWVGWNKTIARPSSIQFKKLMVGQRFIKFRRRGKFIIIELSKKNLVLISHFRMTGHFRIAPIAKSKSKREWFVLPADRFSRVAFLLDRQEVLHFSDIRKFGRLWLIPKSQIASLPELKDLGPEPLEKGFNKQIFVSCMRSYKGMVKPVLLNQECVAGIGNIYADESLFDARIHPKTRVERLTNQELTVLSQAVVKNLKAGVSDGGSSIGEYISVKGKLGRHSARLRVYGQDGKPCHANYYGKSCQGIVKRIVVAQRGTHICPVCQKIKK